MRSGPQSARRSCGSPPTPTTRRLGVVLPSRCSGKVRACSSGRAGDARRRSTHVDDEDTFAPRAPGSARRSGFRRGCRRTRVDGQRHRRGRNPPRRSVSAEQLQRQRLFSARCSRGPDPFRTSTTPRLVSAASTDALTRRRAHGFCLSEGRTLAAPTTGITPPGSSSGSSRATPMRRWPARARAALAEPADVLKVIAILQAGSRGVRRFLRQRLGPGRRLAGGPSAGSLEVRQTSMPASAGATSLPPASPNTAHRSRRSRPGPRPS